MSASREDVNAAVIDEFRANGGRAGGMLDGTPLLLLHHAGARSGRHRVNPLAYLGDDGRYVVVASSGGAPSHPGWYRNVIAKPNVTIEVGPRTIEVVAREARGDEGERLFHAQAERFPTLREYERMTDRVIPVVVLTPRDQGRRT
jgi:deazaflavin-dependent oxidoreductase (nitroreductase family)